MAESTPIVEWRDGVPISIEFDDPYYSLGDGAAESAHVFLAGNGLPERFRPGFRIAELGFGTGLNLIVAAKAWCESGVDGPLHVTSFEQAPLRPAEMRQAVATFPAYAAIADALITALEARPERIDLPWLQFRLINGDANNTLPAWGGAADAWFLDGFSPAKNPSLWGEALMAEVARHTAPGGTAATYTAAGHVRRALSSAGFTVERRAGFARKRHMTVAWMA
ncbi:MAG: tRNA (5-methylaminomethyl-2-thiouridine)(34)-methyltransferase MnmD [Pseudomonadota bacterium]